MASMHQHFLYRQPGQTPTRKEGITDRCVTDRFYDSYSKQIAADHCRPTQKAGPDPAWEHRPAFRYAKSALNGLARLYTFPIRLPFLRKGSRSFDVVFGLGKLVKQGELILVGFP